MRLGWFVVFASAAFAQANPDVLLMQTFEGDASGWVASGEGASVATTGDTFRVRTGHKALEFSYDLAPKRFSGAILGAPETIARMKTLRFWARSDHNTAVGVLLSEKRPGGANYAAWFWAPANQWQAIELTPADFTVTDGPNDAPDPDGKLDLDQVQGIALFDLAQFFGSMAPKGDVPMRVVAASGHHTLLIDTFEVSAAEPVKPAAVTGPVAEIVAIDPPDRDFLQWVTPGKMDLRTATANGPLGARGLQATYKQTEGELEVLVRRVSDPKLSKAKRLVFDVASEHESTLVLSVEMSKEGGGTGARYTLPIYPPGGREVFHVDVKLDDFDGPAGHFDPSKWRSIAILDITGGSDTNNTLWIGNVQAVN